MQLDYVALWTLVIANTFAILLIVRQLARLPQFARRTGPRTGTPVHWTLRSPDGRVMSSKDAPNAYTLLFVASTCKPCHALFEDLRARGKPPATLYVVSQGDGVSLTQEAPGTFDLLLEGGVADLYRELQIPGTPWAVAVSDGVVVATGAASNVPQLSIIMGLAADDARATRTG